MLRWVFQVTAVGFGTNWVLWYRAGSIQRKVTVSHTHTHTHRLRFIQRIHYPKAMETILFNKLHIKITLSCQKRENSLLAWWLGNICFGGWVCTHTQCVCVCKVVCWSNSFAASKENYYCKISVICGFILKVVVFCPASPRCIQ